ncbi:Lrp/AsnC family transcriptional regulator [Streptomyces sp. NPDC102473]|uniref:Lrp/AsnC family transcriptional regulator n=1 Tax=Streptomyces sp. NPDC102473 TaxID=3366180 RepID=UPI0038009170
MHNTARIDSTDARLLLALAAHPRATAVALAEHTGLSRNTVQARLTALDRTDAVGSFERRISPAALGYPLAAFVTVQVVQRRLDEVASALAAIPEVLQVQGLSGESDLLVNVVATDAEDLYRIAAQILGIPDVERSTTALVMRQLVDYRIGPLLRRAATRKAGRPR